MYLAGALYIWLVGLGITSGAVADWLGHRPARVPPPPPAPPGPVARWWHRWGWWVVPAILMVAFLVAASVGQPPRD